MNIKKLREEKGFTQKEIANLLGVTHTAISNYEKGIREPNIKNLIKLADIFGCSLDELLREEVPEEKNESNSQTFANLEN